MPRQRKTDSEKLIDIEKNITAIKADKDKQRFETERSTRFADLKAYLKSCYESSKQWRRTSHEPNWDKYHRNSRNVYDPDKLAKKKQWQITMFVPLTIKHKERVKSQVYRTLIGGRPHFDIETRTGGEHEQAKMLKELVLYYMEKANFEVKFNDQIDQGVTYGSGISKLYWKTIKEKRKIREPVREKSEMNVMEQIVNFFRTGRLPKTVKYKTTEKEVETFRGVVYDWTDIHDIFPDPFDPTFKKSWLFHRAKMTYGEMFKGAQEGYFYRDAVERLRNVREGDETPEDKREEKADRGEADVSPIKRTDFEKPHTICEFWGRLPRKWIYFNEKFGKDEGEEIIPAKAIMTEDGNEVLNVEENDSYDGDNIFNKLDYIRIPGCHYGIGVPELLWGIQEEINELRNQRVDNGTLRMNLMLAVMDDALVDADEDLMSEAGGVIRIARRRYDDVRKAVQKIELGRTEPSEFQETLELEREAQEATGVGRVTLGTGGQMAKDTNQTARGMQMLKQSSLELLSYYTAIMEAASFVKIIRDFYILIYQNITMEEIGRILGDERALKFELLSIEEVEKYYKFKPTGTFTMENRLQKAQSCMMFKQIYELSPFIKQLPLARRIARLLDIDDPDEILLNESEIQGGGGPVGMPGAPLGPQGHVGTPTPAFTPPSATSPEIGALGAPLESPLQ